MKSAKINKYYFLYCRKALLKIQSFWTCTLYCAVQENPRRSLAKTAAWETTYRTQTPPLFSYIFSYVFPGLMDMDHAHVSSDIDCVALDSLDIVDDM